MKSSTKAPSVGVLPVAENAPLLTSDWEQVLALLPVDLEATARTSHALLRRRAVKSAADLLRLVLAYAVWDWPLRLVGAWCALIGLGALSDVAVLKRLRHASGWLGVLIGAVLRQRRIAWAGQAGVRVRLVDATVVNQPGPTRINRGALFPPPRRRPWRSRRGVGGGLGRMAPVVGWGHLHGPASS